MDDSTLWIKKRSAIYKCEFLFRSRIGALSEVNEERFEKGLLMNDLAAPTKNAAGSRTVGGWKINNIENSSEVKLCGSIVSAIEIEITYESMNAGLRICSHYRSVPPTSARSSPHAFMSQK
jgi:hypothetical protein